MRKVGRLGLIILIVSALAVLLVNAVSEWKFGDTVQLIVTTTNMGEVDVVRSTGEITIRDPRGIEFQAGSFDVEGVVHPGEAVRVPVNWDTSVALLNASWVPGYYDIILDGELAYANGEYEETHSDVDDAFRLYLGSTGLFELPEIVYEADITGITQLSDTYYPGSLFTILVWIENTESTLFVPEVHVSFSCEDDYTFEPEARCYYEDECEPGMNQYIYQCQLPDDMPEGTCEYDVDLEMHCIEVEVTDDTYPDGLAGFWHDYYILSEVGSEPDEDWYEFTIDVEPTYVATYPEGQVEAFYDLGLYLYDEGYWPDDDFGYIYCLETFYSDGVISETEAETIAVSCGEDYPESVLVDCECLASLGDGKPWEWTSNFGDEGYHNIEVEIRERQTTDIGASDIIAVYVERKIYQDEPAPLYVWVTNECDYAFLPEFTLTIPEIDEDPVVTLYGDDVQNIAPPGTSVYKLEVDVSEIPPSEEGYYFELSIEPSEIYLMELSEDGLVEEDTLYYRFFRDNEVFLSEGETFDERLEVQGEANNMWRWVVPDDEWFSAGPHTIYVEVTDDLSNPDFTGDRDRIGIATLEVTITDDDQASEGGTDDSSDDTGGSDSTDGSNPAGTTGGTEPDEETPPEEDSEEETQGLSIQSIIDMILSFFQNLFG